MLKKILKHKWARVLVRIIKSIIKNDFYGMAAEMGFMLVVGFFPFVLFLMAVFGWLGNRSYLDTILRVLSKQHAIKEPSFNSQMSNTLLGNSYEASFSRFK